MNILYYFHRYVEKLQVPSKQLVSKLYKSLHILSHSNLYCSEWHEIVVCVLALRIRRLYSEETNLISFLLEADSTPGS